MMSVDSETLFKHKENAKALLNVRNRTRLTFVTAANIKKIAYQITSVAILTFFTHITGDEIKKKKEKKCL